jgi:ribosome-associated protein
VGRGGSQSRSLGRLFSLTLANVLVAARAASAKTLEKTVVLDVGDLIGITDYFIITAGRNERQVRSIVDEVSRCVRELAGVAVRQVEGLEGMHWVLLDYGDFVVHVFDTEARALYSLERLWADAPRVMVEDVVSAEVARS